MRTVLVFLVLFSCARAFADDERSVISIENAQKTEYKKDVVTGADTIVLTGGVRISVSRGGNKTTIFADMVNYNRETDMMYAEGNVQLEQTGTKAGGERVSAKTLLFNTATLEGIFDNGHVVQTQSDALNLPSGSTLNVASTIFGRDSGGTIAFKNGELTFCDDDDPHWRIKASRIWLLPGGEFAFFSAILFVGHVPLLYFPAFYYPKDELIFNPAFGYRNREGYYINTTAYIIGRKPLDARSSVEANRATGSSSSDDSDDKINFFSLMKTNALKEQRREGIVMHNLDKDYTGDTTNYLKVMADYYANLGVMVGLDGVFRPNDIITSLAGNLRLGWSNTIFKNGTTYLPYAASGATYSDSSHFMGISLPFRYASSLKMTLARPLSLTLSLPLYSDPYFDYDFNNRAETMDWIDFLMSNPSSDTDEPTISEVSSFTWQLDGSYTVPLPDLVSPYLSSLAISSFSSSLIFSAQSNTTLSTDDDYRTYSPERKFYYPSQVTPFTTSVRLAGTIVQYPPAAKKKTSRPAPALMQPPPAIAPDGEEDADNAENADNAEDGADGDETDDAESGEDGTADEEVADEEALGGPSFSETALPLLATTAPARSDVAGLSYKLDYAVTADFTSQLSYASTDLHAADDFSWDNVQATYYRAAAPATLTSSLGYRGQFVSLTDTFTFNPVYQDHPYIDDADKTITSTRNSDYNARKLDLTDTNALTFRPLYYTEHFSETSLTWNTTIKMVQTKYISDDPEEPEWEFLTTDLTDEECLTAHNLNFVLAAKEGSFGQKLSLTTQLPPLVDRYSGILSLTFPYTTFSIGTGIRQTSKDDDTWIKEDVSQSLSFSLFGDRIKLTQSWIYDLEEDDHESFRLSLSGYGVQLAYTMGYVIGYDFDQSKGWVAQTEKKFQPQSVSLAYTSGTKNFSWWSDRVAFAPSLSTSIVYDCMRPTYSYFKFVPAFTFKINNMLDITFSAESRNDAIYRYVTTYSDEQQLINPLTDLINSFNFFDTSKREASNFKLKQFSVKVTHDLHDWDLSAAFSISPKLITVSNEHFDSGRNGGRQYYDFSPHITISVVWRPMESLKTAIVDEYGEWELNP